MAALPLQFRDIVPRRHQADQMPAGRTADGADVLRVVAIFFGVTAQPADRGLGVVNLRRVDRHIGKAIADRGQRKSVLGEVEHGRIGLVAPGRARHTDGHRVASERADDDQPALPYLQPV